ncbi:hypothetical protein [Cobetia crustatorum]
MAELRATSVQHIGELTTANVRRVLQLNV